MLLDRHRVARLVDLSELTARLGPAARMLRAEEVKALIQAAYDDASDAARQAFMRQVEASRAGWPWSAVTAAPGAAPPLMTLLLGQVLAADDDPGDRLPSRGQLGSAAFEALHAALERWDTVTIRRHIGPQGWVAGPAGAPLRQQGFDPGASSARARSAMHVAPTSARAGRGGQGGRTPTGGGGGPAGGTGAGHGAGETGGAGGGTGTDVPAEGGEAGSEGTSLPTESTPTTWSRGATIAAVAAGVGAVGLVALAVGRARQDRELETLRERLQEYEP